MLGVVPVPHAMPSRRDRENVSAIVAKKRELFNLQLKLEINRSELQALDLADKLQDAVCC